MAFWWPSDDVCVTQADRTAAKLLYMANERHKIVDQDKKDKHTSCSYMFKATRTDPLPPASPPPARSFVPQHAPLATSTTH